jgi:hypothetical protein
MSGCSACRESTRVPQENQNLILKQESIRNPRLPPAGISVYLLAKRSVCWRMSSASLK